MALNGQHYDQEPVSPVSAISSRRLSHKPDLPDLRRVSGGQEKEEVGRISLDNVPPRGSSWRHSADFHKPLPHLPKETATNDSTKHDSDHAIPRKPIVETSDTPIDPSKYVDLSNTKQTHVNVNWSPAVTHEVRQVDTHEIVQEAITREIHNHHIYHRVLPVIDVEILPARHFVPTADGGYREISEAEIPHGSNPDRLQQIIQEAVNNSMPKYDGPSGRRAFTARKFEGTEGDYREHTTPDGAKHTEQWWVHPPTLETGGQESGQTAPFYFDSEDPEDDGFRGFQHKTPPGLRSLREAQAARRTEAFSSDVTGRFATPPTHTILPFRMAHGTPAS
ncbi:Hypothetical predicted protein [Lecanosticta acicola]|uniref:Uncharacterized protein n=1 Tax=Lecanosticta acicola TaxID=111012 RepID=A0AAI8Z0Z9_9PEZI|nr:Hypothetical predicted protein [Lecanosticta acicola]